MAIDSLLLGQSRRCSTMEMAEKACPLYLYRNPEGSQDSLAVMALDVDSSTELQREGEENSSRQEYFQSTVYSALE
ncbi:hypothetical protein GW17_00060763 [Ensete ventricosum]|nr:hypothetical protein GW17_00060763 [Ensete ventricosum]